MCLFDCWLVGFSVCLFVLFVCLFVCLFLVVVVLVLAFVVVVAVVDFVVAALVAVIVVVVIPRRLNESTKQHSSLGRAIVWHAYNTSVSHTHARTHSHPHTHHPHTLHRTIGLEYEYILQEKLLNLKVSFLTEDDLRVLGHARTPDVKLQVLLYARMRCVCCGYTLFVLCCFGYFLVRDLVCCSEKQLIA